MNFFQSIQAMQVAGDWTIAIAKEQNGNLAVSVTYFNRSIGDNASKIVPPIILKGTAQEIDEGFFNAIVTPITDTAQLFSNMEQYLKQKEQAKLASQMEKDKKEKADKEKTDRQKKFEASMKQADELEAEGKHRDAWMKVPDVSLYPEYEEQIRKRKSELSAIFSPNLFSVEPQND